MLAFAVRRTAMLAWGMLRLRTRRKAFVHPSSTINCAGMIRLGGTLTVEKDCHIDALSREGIVFGNNVSIGKHTCIECTGSLKTLGKGLVVGDNVGLGSNGSIGCAGGVEIGDNTIFGAYVSIHPENHNFADPDVPIRLQGVNHKGIKIGRDCWLGAKVTILDGTVLGDGCVVAAGAVVRGTIPPYSVIGGIPARVLKTRPGH